MYHLVKRLWPICRSITGVGVRETLAILQEYLPNLRLYEVPTGSQHFDWQVPKEWNIRDAYIIAPDGKKIIDFHKNNLHVVGYSIPVDIVLSLEELKSHLYTLPDQPDAIPYITSYYQERWGFCLTHQQYEMLTPGQYQVKIDSELKEGYLTYGELLIPGKTKKEIFLSTYICHPSMANNELSGPTVTTFLAQWIESLPDRHYSYRIIFIPETIGSIVYLHQHLSCLQRHVIAGYVITCVGDDRAYSYLPSRFGNTLADQAAKHVLQHIDPHYLSYSFLQRGSDERQYCYPGVDLPIASIMRSKYGVYPEYHTSLDNLDLVTPQGLSGGFNVIKQAIFAIEKNCVPKNTMLCEPQLGKRGLYPTLSSKNSANHVQHMLNLLGYADGVNSLLDIANLIQVPFWELYPIYEKLLSHHLLTTDMNNKCRAIAYE